LFPCFIPKPAIINIPIKQARADDKEIVERAISENRILVTLDQHFGDWAVLPLSHHPGVVRLKVNPTTSENV
jgi:predicted nuclease of predicted toxin-antitoxin system